ncbi:zinc-dependent metalloprotease [Leptolyngbya boryana CZ1]|uniref:Zinc-dependent metalloprotease n=1 Tax=Leptolyngbya boryana CZ1 TaxID=3060204 RepID=A0AA97ASG2_LEPBY|nr:zinc-dependent metalloprotease [Leptolyngbya boryana]WNZ44815.1 zinc-dependent metalloprotease [Leptolyngbya boryana CZ1]
MKRASRFLAFLLGLMLVMLPASIPWIVPSMGQSSAKPAQKPTAEPDRSQLRPFDDVIKETKTIKGLFTLYRNEKNGKLFAEILPDQLERNYLATMTLESGIGQSGIYSGLPIGDFLFTFRRVNNNIQFVVPNIYFRAERGLPIERSIQRSFSDSVLQSLSIRSIHAERKSFLVELNPLLLSDLPGLLPVLSATLGGSYSPEASASYFETVKAFPQNVEVESVFGFTGGDKGVDAPTYINTLPDSRAFSLRVRYSLSQLPENNGYRPRLADDRIGYFITAYKDFTNDNSRRPFVRYINRWNLQKQDPAAPVSKPKQPIVFWIENSVPLEYRDAVRDGALFWNQAFEKAGFKDAIEVKQMPEQADWDPADVRYNTIRWFNSNDAIFAMGPSRVNPLTGEILDADIMVSADFTRVMKEDYRTLVEQNQMRTAPFVSQLVGNANLCNYGMAARSLAQTAKAQEKKPIPRLRFGSHLGNYQDLCFGVDTAKQFAVGNMFLGIMQNELPSSPERKAFAQEFMRELIAHEVGHTLGLRHNFHASAMLKPEELNNPAITQQRGLTASVMDYAPVNLAPLGTKQGDYFTHRVGAYDEWAIEYGYTPIDAKVPQAEKRELDKIAQRAPTPELAYATDEDVTTLDPKVNVFDLSGDLLTYAQWQLTNAREMWNRVNQRFPVEGDSFNEVRVAFNAVLDYYFQYSLFLPEYIGGQYFNRFKAGDAKGRLPFEPVSVEQQRQALALINQYVFSEEPFRFSPDLLNKLAPSRWAHWGSEPTSNLDYPIHDNILFLQSIVLYDLLNYDRLARLRDSELRVQAGQPTLTIPDLFDSLQSSIWGEVTNPKDNLKLSGLRRALQRQYMNAMISMILREVEVPEDARTVARYELRKLQKSIDRAMRKVNDRDIYTKAHLEEAQDRIGKALEAQLRSQ